jgi:MYXO-CTERM domain-containing protein
MVAAGVSDSVGLTLVVLANTSVQPQNFDNYVIPDADITYDFAAAAGSRSNYQQLFTAAMQRPGGRTWVTETVTSVLEGLMDYDGGTTQRPTIDGGSGIDAMTTALDATVQDPMDASPISVVGDPLIDRGIAFVGLSGHATVTRLRTRLGIEKLDADLLLEPAMLLTLGPQREATQALNVPCPTPPVTNAGSSTTTTTSTSSGCSTTRPARDSIWLVATLSAMGFLAVRRRRR